MTGVDAAILGTLISLTVFVFYVWLTCRGREE